MTNYLNRLRFLDSKGKIRVNTLAFPFLFATGAYGIGFALFNKFSGVSKSSLYQAMYEVGPHIPILWGILAIAAATLAMLLLITRILGVVGEASSMMGFLVWLYAAFIYLDGGFYLVLITVALPHVYFWGWYYTRVKWWARTKKARGLTDAG